MTSEFSTRNNHGCTVTSSMHHNEMIANAIIHIRRLCTIVIVLIKHYLHPVSISEYIISSFLLYVQPKIQVVPSMLHHH